MSEERLPEEYKGFSTAELLKIWKSFPDRTLYHEPIPREKNFAWQDLLREYALMDFGPDDNPEKIRRSKKLLAPYGIDPAPWADENGIEQEHLRKAYHERSLKEEQERRKRHREIYRKKSL